jgi:hypothetical protein
MDSFFIEAAIIVLILKGKVINKAG